MSGDEILTLLLVAAILVGIWIGSLRSKNTRLESEKRNLLAREFERMKLVVERTYSSVQTGGKPEIEIGGESYTKGDLILDHVYDEDAEDDLAYVDRGEDSPFCIIEIQEPSLDDHHMAFLATVAKAGPSDPFCRVFAQLYASGKLTFSRTDLAAVAKALYECVCLEGVAPDAAMIREKLRAGGVTVQDGLLKGIMDGSKEACIWRIRIVDYETGGKFLDRTIEHDESTEPAEDDES